MGPRTRLAWGFGASLLVVLAMLAATSYGEGSTQKFLGFWLKLTLIIGTMWLAWPDLVRVGKRLPPKIVVLALITLVGILIQPRFGALLLALTLVYWAGWWLYQKVFVRPNSIDRPM